MNKINIHACLRKASERNPPLASASDRSLLISLHLQASRMSWVFGLESASSSSVISAMGFCELDRGLELMLAALPVRARSEA